jgi:type I restriction-modification system DNA methylase subunit
LKTNKQLLEFGITPSSIRALDGSASPDLLDYLDLVEPRGNHGLMPNGVVESNGRPLLFFVNESRLASLATEQEVNLSDLRRRLACRGDRAYLAHVLPGELKVVPVSLDDQTPEWKSYSAGTGEATTFFSRLALGEYDGEGQPKADFVFTEMFALLKQGADGLAEHLNRADVLSLIGRALFFRFLWDRQIVKEETKKAIAPTATSLLACFETAQSAAATCQWLDFTFNGDFLPLSDDGSETFFEDARRKTNGEVFIQLSAIVRRERRRQLQFDWGDFDFAHVPVGLLSQVYEAFCWKWEPQNAEATSVYYTPRNIAATLVNEAFDNVPNAKDCKVLDPACGAGLFLVLAFRRIYLEQWRATSQRPDTKSIRDILYHQLTGFEISEAALKFSALSLYLTAIELDPEPIPPEKLKFNKLQSVRLEAPFSPGAVLYNFRRDEPAGQMVIGSLGDHVGRGFDGKFNLILSNPPWTSLPKSQKDLAKELDNISQSIISQRDQSVSQKYRNPDNSPDLPFVWKSTEWCKPGGRIAMALPARTLFKQSKPSRQAREALFRQIEITGIINCSNLRKTNVWPDMDQPFMLLFARNLRPNKCHSLRFISPHTEKTLNALGEVRIDAESATPVDIEATLKEPWLWKALAVSTPLDIEVVRKIKASRWGAFQKYWQKDLGLVSSSGYQIKPKQTQRDAKPLQELRDLSLTDLFPFVVDTHQLEKFARDTVCWPRLRRNDADKLRVYRGPLLLVKESPGPDRSEGWAPLCFDDVAYNESFYGYSASGHPNGEMLVRYVQLFVHSRLWVHYALLTSAKLGVERPNVNKADLDEFPLIPLEQLNDQQRNEVTSLSKRLIAGDATVFAQIDSFFGKIYGLDQLDLEVVQDTLEVRDPNDELGRRASSPPTPAESSRFGRRLESVLRPFFRVLGKEPEVTLWRPTDGSQPVDAPFAVLMVGETGRPVGAPDSIFAEKVLPLAIETGATRVIATLPEGLLIGLLRHYRYWTPSRARLLGAQIVRQYMDSFEG